MSDKKYIDKVHSGDTFIREDVLNSVIHAANILNASGFDPDTIDYMYDDGVSRHVSNRVYNEADPTEPDYEFKVVEESGNTVSFTCGHWLRNGFDTNAASQELSVTTYGNTHYVVVTLDTAGVYNPALIPNGASVTIEDSLPAYDEFNNRMVVAEITTSANSISDVYQIYRGGRKEDNVDIPDGETESAVAPVRKTIQFNPAEYEHRRELQLHNVSNAYASSTTVPYFTAGADIGSGKGSAGELAWAAPDTNLAGYDNESIEVHTVTAPAPVMGKVVLQIYGFESASSAGTPNGADLLLFKDATNEDVEYLSFTDLLAWIDASITLDCDDVKDCITAGDWLCTQVSACFDCSWISACTIYHYYLDFTNAGSPMGGCNWDHHQIYGQQGGAFDDTYGAVFFQSLGRGDTPQCSGGSATSKAIDLVNSELWAASAMVLDWENRWFEVGGWQFGCSSPVTILSDVESTSCITGALVVYGGIGVAKDVTVCQDVNVAGVVYTSKLEIDATNYWDVDNLLVTVASAVDLNAPNIRIESETNDITLLSSADVAITTMDDMNLTLGADLIIGGDTGWSGTFWVNNGTTQVTVTKGWVVTPAP